MSRLYSCLWLVRDTRFWPLIGWDWLEWPFRPWPGDKCWLLPITAFLDHYHSYPGLGISLLAFLSRLDLHGVAGPGAGLLSARVSSSGVGTRQRLRVPENIWQLIRISACSATILNQTQSEYLKQIVLRTEKLKRLMIQYAQLSDPFPLGYLCCKANWDFVYNSAIF